LDVGEKGIISNSIDSAIEEKDIVEKASWAVEAVKSQYRIKPDAGALEMPIDVLEKMMSLTYALGSTLSSIVTDIVAERYSQKVDEWLYSRWVKDFGGDKADKMLAEKIVRETKESEKTKPLKIEFTDEDYVYVREKIASVTEQFKIKINQEYALKKSNK